MLPGPDPWLEPSMILWLFTRGEEAFYRKRIGTDGASARARVELWRELTLECAVRVNPFSFVRAGQPFPANLDSDYFPDGRLQVAVPGGQVELDDVPVAHEAYAQLAQGQLQQLIANPTDNSALEWFRSYTVQAGWEAFRKGEYERALRFFVNYERLRDAPGIDGIVRRNWAKCLSELGDHSNAASCYLNAATDAEAHGRTGEAADAYECAGLSWEAIPGGGERPSLGIEATTYNSSLCFRKAKCLYSSLGDYAGASRCSVLERSAERRWQPLRANCALSIASHFAWLHGESPWFVLRSVIVSLIFFALGFWVLGFESVVSAIPLE